MRSDLVETFKIVNGKYDFNPGLLLQLDEGGRRGHDLKLFQKRFRLQCVSKKTPPTFLAVT